MTTTLNTTHIRACLGVLACSLVWVMLSSQSAAAPVPKLGTKPYVKWTVKSRPSDGLGLSRAVVAKELVIVGTADDALRAFRAETGAVAWVYKHGSIGIHEICTDGDRVYFTTSKTLTAVTADKGNPVWSFELSKYAGPIAVVPAKGLVVATDASGAIYGFDAKTGTKAWSTEFLTDAPPNPPRLVGNIFRAVNTKARPQFMIVDDGTIYLWVLDQCRVIAYDVTTGKKRWSHNCGGPIPGSLTVTGKYLFFGSENQFFHCLDKQTGQEVWKTEEKGFSATGGAADDENIYIGSTAGSLRCLRQEDGQEQWRCETSRNPAGKRTAIISVQRGSQVYFTTLDGQFYVVDVRKGTVIERLSASADIPMMYCTPAINGRSFFTTSSTITKPVESFALTAIGLK